MVAIRVSSLILQSLAFQLALAETFDITNFLQHETIQWHALAKKGAEVRVGGPSHSDAVEVPAGMFPLTAVFIAGVVFFIYGQRGFAVVCSVLVYLFSLTTIKLSVKWVFVTHSFAFSKFVTCLHFLSCACVSGALLMVQRGSIPRATLKEFSYMILPISLAMALSIGADNMALVFCSAAFTEIIGSTNCLVTIFMILAMGMPFNIWLMLPACVVALGCALGSVGEANFSLLGTLLCLTACVFRSLKVALQQKLMTGESKEKFDPCASLFWICVPSSAIMFTLSLVFEGLQPYRVLSGRSAWELYGLCLAILASCVNACFLNLAQLFVTKDLGAVGGQLVAQSKMVLVVLGGMVLFGEHFSRLEAGGFCLALVGVYTFSRMDQAFKEKETMIGKEGGAVADAFESTAKCA